MVRIMDPLSHGRDGLTTTGQINQDIGLEEQGISLDFVVHYRCCQAPKRIHGFKARFTTPTTADRPGRRAVPKPDYLHQVKHSILRILRGECFHTRRGSPALRKVPSA